jgi:Fungal specific transcription factor domain
MFDRPDGVQAYFCQNLGSPCLEYMLCSNALRLAVAKGFHREPVASWNLSKGEVNQRRSIFWSIYCLEKQIVCQSGRPSVGQPCQLRQWRLMWFQAIEDDDITCELPTTARTGSAMNVRYARALIMLSQLMSTATRTLANIQTARPGDQIVLETVFDLNERADRLRQSLEPVIRLNDPIDPGELPFDLTLQQIVYLHYTFYNTLIYIHATLGCPWGQALLRPVPHSLLHQQIQESSQILAGVCRKAILTTEHIHFNAGTPVP